jgi:hypothetical protein
MKRFLRWIRNGALVVAALVAILAAIVIVPELADYARGYRLDDERRMRALLGEFGPGAELVTAEANQTRGGWFGREGLRLTGLYRLPAAARARFEHASPLGGWSPLPIGDRAAGLRDFPREWRSSTNGLFACRVGVYTGPGMEDETAFSYSPCSSSPPPTTSRWDVLIYDRTTGVVTVLMKAFY